MGRRSITRQEIGCAASLLKLGFKAIVGMAALVAILSVVVAVCRFISENWQSTVLVISIGSAIAIALWCLSRIHKFQESRQATQQRYSGDFRTQNAPPLLQSDFRGLVYLLRSGVYYKIGLTVDMRQRFRTIQLQLPFPVEQVHVIYTNTPNVLEKYWHDRFAGKRQNGEWFCLDARDIAEFKKHTSTLL